MWNVAAWGFFFVCFGYVPVYAYVGPGVGITLIGWLIGGVAVMGVACFATLRWPIEKFLEWYRSRSARRVSGDSTVPSDTDTNGSGGRD